MQLLVVLAFIAISLIDAKRDQVLSVDKRPQRFHAWGGKRSDALQQNIFNKNNPDFEIEQNRYFQNDQFIDKRKFHAWGGKRSPLSSKALTDLGLYPRSDKGYDTDIKRMFHPWGGKRSGLPIARASFPDLKYYGLLDTDVKQDSGLAQPKADITEDSSDFPLQTKRRFQPWGGK